MGLINIKFKRKKELSRLSLDVSAVAESKQHFKLTNVREILIESK